VTLPPISLSVKSQNKRMTYTEAIEYLYKLRWFGAKFGLSNTLKLAELVGNPQQHLRFIHVAGTNGKGSTCAMLESIYRAAGLRVGLFTSPHLVAFGERIQVDRESISEAGIVRQVEELQPLLAQFPVEHHPTFFEAVTVMALRYFAAQKCDLVIWETGLGGRLDATNIVTPLASVITNIQYDHEKWLGSTLAAIAAEKAGIIKPGVPVISGVEEPEALKVIQETALSQNAPLKLIGLPDVRKPPLNHLALPLPGEHQRMNAALAIATVRVLAATIPLTDQTIADGLSKVNWPGRLQLVTEPSGRKILLDGAHNLAGAQVLAAAIQQFFPGQKVSLIIGILADKNWSGMGALLAPLANHIRVVPVQSERTAKAGELAAICRHANPAAQVLEFDSLSAALAASATGSALVVAGSLYLVGEVLETLGIIPQKGHAERGLNEWQTAEPS
jgi:dihydrofolate synthase/folylpolyglutamate synthase